MALYRYKCTPIIIKSRIHEWNFFISCMFRWVDLKTPYKHNWFEDKTPQKHITTTALKMNTEHWAENKNKQKYHFQVWFMKFFVYLVQLRVNLIQKFYCDKGGGVHSFSYFAPNGSILGPLPLFLFINYLCATGSRLIGLSWFIIVF